MRSAQADPRCAPWLRRLSSSTGVRRVPKVCRRSADGTLGVVWLLVLPLTGGEAARRRAGEMRPLGAVDLGVEHGTRRARPVQHCDDVRACVSASDRFGLPSGHTLQAVSFALPLSACDPARAPLPWGLALLVGASRVVPGLHCPSDVPVGTVVGVGTARVLLQT